MITQSIFDVYVPRRLIKKYFTKQSLVRDKKLRGELNEKKVLLQIYSFWKNKIIVGHNLKDKLRSLQIRIDEVMGIRNLSGARTIIKSTKVVNRNWSKISKLESIYYQLIGKSMKNARALDNVKAVKARYRAIESTWEDRYGPLVDDYIQQLAEEQEKQSESDLDKMFMWVDEQKLDASVVIEDVNNKKTWRLTLFDKGHAR